MLLLAFGLVGMIALVLCAVFLGMSPSSTKRTERRMAARSAKLDYIRLAREADASRKAKRAAEGSDGARGEGDADSTVANPPDTDKPSVS